MSDETLTPQDLVDSQTHDGLVGMATNLGIENPAGFETDLSLAGAIIEAEAQRDLTASEGASGEANESQVNTPAGDVPPVNDDETGAQAPDEESTAQVLAEVPQGSEVSTFDRVYGHLEGDALETAKTVFSAQEQQQADSDAIQARGYTGD